MKRLLLVFVAVGFISCSFDNKTGIWKDASNTPVDNQTSKSITDNKLYAETILVNARTGKQIKPPSAGQA